jgi:Xaa-Pro aminopeptidase
MFTADYAARLQRFSHQLSVLGIDAAIISPGPDLRYLSGYDAIPLERLTALIIQPAKSPIVVSPLLEKPAALASPIGSMGLDVVTWTETENPFSVVHSIIGDVQTVCVDGRMWADKALKLQREFTNSVMVSANQAVAALRQVKDAQEVQALREAGDAIDVVHSRVHEFLKVGRTEAEVGRDIAAAIIESGHATADFVIVASGPNSASPHHEVSDRVICKGDAVVVDIGGTMPNGYCSDSTRTYFMGSPSERYTEMYAALLESQLTSTRHVRPGVSCESVDKAARDVLNDAGIGEYFIHRVGHGIGLETHEEPYMVEGNTLALEPGFAFSIEPGFYVEGWAGARIEDIVVCGEESAIVLNNRPRELAILEA